MKRILFFGLAAAFAITALMSCEKEEAKDVLLRCNVDKIDPTSVTFSFTAEVPANETGHYCGIAISNEDPMGDISNGVKKEALPGKNTYTITIPYLTPDSQYYARAYVYQGKAGLEWGEMVSVTPTLVITSDVVDMGLSVNWSSYNLGAKEIGYGMYYQWGDTQGYGKDVSDGKYFFWCDSNSNTTYKWCKGGAMTLTKYCPNKEYGADGYTDSYTTLEMSDDAASVALGGNWRIPTTDEWKELRENCTLKVLTVQGVKGFLLYSTIKGYTDNCIFLPLGGYRKKDNLLEFDSSAYYWTSEVSKSFPYEAWYSQITSAGLNKTHSDRAYGMQIRPVSDKTE